MLRFFRVGILPPLAEERDGGDGGEGVELDEGELARDLELVDVLEGEVGGEDVAGHLGLGGIEPGGDGLFVVASSFLLF